MHAYFTPTPPAAYLYFNLFSFSSTAELKHCKMLTNREGKQKDVMVDPPIKKKKKVEFDLAGIQCTSYAGKETDRQTNRLYVMNLISVSIQ